MAKDKGNEQADIIKLKEYVKDSEKTLRGMLSKWLSALLVVVLVAIFLSIVYLWFYPEAKFDTLDIAKTIIGPCLTANALFIGFVPTIGFFRISELREKREELKEEFDNETLKPENIKVFYLTRKLACDFWVNVGIGIKKYIRLYLLIAIASLLSLLLAYIILESRDFLLIDFYLLVLVSTGIYPIAEVALNEPFKTVEK